MAIFRTKGYRDIKCTMGIAAIFPPPTNARSNPDKKGEDDLVFHVTITNERGEDGEKSTYIELNKRQIRELGALIESYLKTGVNKEI